MECSEPAPHVLAAEFAEPWATAPANDPGPVDAAAAGSPDHAQGRLSRDDFFSCFRFAVAAPNMAVKPPLASLQIDDGDMAARAASDALYETCQDVPWLNFLIEPGSVWAGRVIVIGGFFFGLSRNVTAEMAARNAKPNTPRESGSPAPNPGGNGGNPAAVVPLREHVDMEEIEI